MRPESGSPRWRRRAAMLSPLLVLALSSVLALALAVGASLAEPAPTASACGLANTPTMLADTAPAIPTPVTPTSDPNQPVGFFPGAYYLHQAIAFTEDLSSVPNAPPLASLELLWDFGDGSPPIIGTAPHHTYQHTGSFAVRVTIHDTITGSWNDFDSATITLLGQAWSQPPIARATADRRLVAINESVTFDASDSVAQVGSLVSYTWNFGDTQEGRGPQVTHTFTIPGRALVTLIVTDSRGASSTAVVPVQILNMVTHVQIQLSQAPAQAGQPLTFMVVPTNLPPGDRLISVTWDFGDQTAPEATRVTTITHRYAEPGTYHVQVQVVDAEGIPGVETTQVIIQAAAGADNSLRGLAVWLHYLSLGLVATLLMTAVVVVLRRRKRAFIP